MADIYEVYNRCGSCRHFVVLHTDRMGRTMGECRGRPTHPEVPAHEYGCPEYHLDRERILPGSPVPEDADLAPRLREQARRTELARHRFESRPTVRVRMVRPSDIEPVRRRPDAVPLALADDLADPQSESTELRQDTMQRSELKALLAEVLEEALGVADAPIHPRYHGGKVVIQPANPELQAKEIDIEVFFRKIVTMRDKLRVLEQRINASDKLETAEKVQLQQYITGCYGSMTSFNFLFRDREDWFVGESGK